MTYVFKVVKSFDGLEVGEIIEVDLRITEYDRFKAAHPELERYIDVPPGFEMINQAAKEGPDGRFMERMDHIRHHYPGAKGMFDQARWRPKREF
jgi:hypothetical protein